MKNLVIITLYQFIIPIYYLQYLFSSKYLKETCHLRFEQLWKILTAPNICGLIPGPT